jgi:hypothetical protein
MIRADIERARAIQIEIEIAQRGIKLRRVGALFTKCDYKAAERYCSSNYIQHSAQLPEQLDLPKSGSVYRRRMK